MRYKLSCHYVPISDVGSTNIFKPFFLSERSVCLLEGVAYQDVTFQSFPWSSLPISSNNSLRELNIIITVKPALVTTCLQRPTFFVSLENGFSLKHGTKRICLQRPPVYKDHFLCFPWAVAIDRFDCIIINYLVVNCVFVSCSLSRV